MSRSRALLVAGMALLATTVPAVAATGVAGTTAVCDTSPTAGPEPRHPYAGKDAAAFMAQNPAYSYGENPYVYTLFVPEGLPAGPVPLLVGLHGLGGSAHSHARKGLFELATREGLIVALPSGRRGWMAGEDSTDVKFVRDVVAQVRAERCVDGRRIWAMGESNGAVMAHRLACDAADIFAAVSAHAGKEDRIHPLGGPCRASADQGPAFEPIPIRFSHGTMDATVDYDAGRRALRSWVDRYRCDTKPVDVLPTEYGVMEVYGNCRRTHVETREAATGVPFELRFHTLDDHEHLLPDGCGGTGPGCEDPGSKFPTADDSNNEMHAFFSRHTRPNPAAEQPAPDPAAMPLGDPVSVATWTAELPDHGPDTYLLLVDATGAPTTLDAALREQVVRVEYAVHAPEDHPDEVRDEHPQCPSTAPGSRKIRIVGEPVTLQVTDANGSTEYVAHTAEQAGTGLAVATFQIGRPVGGISIVEATIGQDAVADPLLCTTRRARFQETVQRDAPHQADRREAGSP